MTFKLRSYDATSLPPEGKMVDPSCSGRGRRFVVRLVYLIHEGVEAAVAFDGVPIGIRDGFPQPRRFWRGRCQASGCPGLQNVLGAVETVLVPLTRSAV